MLGSRNCEEKWPLSGNVSDRGPGSAVSIRFGLVWFVRGLEMMNVYTGTPYTLPLHVITACIVRVDEEMCVAIRSHAARTLLHCSFPLSPSWKMHIDID